MRQLLRLLIYVLAAIGFGWLTYWGGGEVGLPQVPRVIFAAIVFGAILLLGLNKTGVADV